MKLFPSKVDVIANEIITRLIGEGDIEAGNPAEAQLDCAAVLKEYIRIDRELTERAKDMMEIRQLPHAQLGRIKRQLAEQKNFGMGDDGYTWITNQILETFMQSPHIEEVYSDDPVLRRKIKDITRKHTEVEDKVDAEVRERIKNVQEGTAAWEIEYNRVLEQVKAKHGLH